MGDNVEPVGVYSQIENGTGNKKKRFYLIANVIVFLISGTASLIIGKLLYQIKAVGRYGDEHGFEKPWFSNFMMFIGMTMLLIQYLIKKKISGSPIKANVPMRKILLYCLAPSFCDALASFLMFLGLLWIRISIWQMIRGSIVIFTGVIRIFFLKKPLKKFEWVGISIVTFGLIIVGLSSLFGENGSTASMGSQILGIFLVLFAQGIQATQTVIEEHLLQGINIDSEFVVGLEGLWGLLMTGCIFMPIAQFLPGSEGSSLHEDTIDSFIMIKNSTAILILNLFTIVTLLFLNFGSMNITLYSNSVTRSIIEPIRTFFVWIFAVAIYYISKKQYLEGLTYYSIIELFGFGVLMFGLFIYYEFVTFKCLEEKSAEADIENKLLDER